jgi:glycosyltransferase involved in cell wall biosynthesis
VQRSAGFGTGVVGVFARATGRRFVFSSSSEADFKLDAATTAAAGASLDHWPTRLQYRLGLRLADVIVVQTDAQRELARAKLGRDALVIPSFATFAPTARVQRRPVFLWVGGVVEFKDPFGYVRLAQLAPETEFWMLPTDRGAAWNELAAGLRTQAAAVPNLTLLPPRPRDELPDLYASVTALVSTSKFEGFPNTFLEAWAQSTPTLSLTVDPDGVIRTHDLGVVADGSLEKLAAAVRRYVRDPAAAAAAGARAYAYVVRVHDSAAVAGRWEAAIASVRRTRSAAAP